MAFSGAFFRRRFTASAVLLTLTSLLAALLVGVAAAPATAGSGARLIQDSPIGTVNSVVTDPDGTRYVGGSFTTVGAASGGVAVVDATTGVVDRARAVVDNGAVYSVVTDGSGGYFLGGTFTSVAGVPRNRLAHIMADGSLNPLWNPNANSDVRSMALSGSTLYIAGAFTTLNGGTVTRNRVAAVGAGDGAVTGWNPNAGGTVFTLAVQGSTVYLGGQFSSVGGVARNNAAAITSYTSEALPGGTLTSWNPTVNSVVWTMQASGAVVYLAGLFTQVGSPATPRNRVAAVTTYTDEDNPGGAVTGWNPNSNQTVYALAVSGSTVYLGGGFGNVGGQARNRLAAVTAYTDEATPGGAITGWNPNSDNIVYSLAVSGSTVYVGGTFTTISATARQRAAALSTYADVDNPGGALLPWAPSANSTVHSLVPIVGSVMMGGEFGWVNLVTRNRVAAFDMSGRLTGWDPNASSTVNAVALSGSTVYLAGAFTSVGGQTRNRAAAVTAYTDAANPGGNVTGWNPNAGSEVRAVAISGSTVYLGGNFLTVGGVSRVRAAAVTAYSDEATPGGALIELWNPPTIGNVVNTMVVSGSTVYIGGVFTSVGSPAVIRSGAMAVTAYGNTDNPGGTLTSWNPSFTGGAGQGVRMLAVSGSTVYVVGDFSLAGGTTTRNGAAAVTAYTDEANPGGTVTGWNPNASSTVYSLALSGPTVYLGGLFTTIGGQTRNRAAAVTAYIDESNPGGTVTPWDPNANNFILAIAVTGSTVQLGGGFSTINQGRLNAQSQYLAEVLGNGVNPPQPASATISGRTLVLQPAVFGVTRYAILYRPVGTSSWAVYANGANNLGVSLTNPGTRNTCSAVNTAAGWTSCPMPLGWVAGTTYQFAAYPTVNGKNSLAPLTILGTYTAP